MRIIKAIFMPLLIAAYQFFMSFAFLVVGEQFFLTLRESEHFFSDLLIMLLFIAIASAIAFGLIMIIKFIALRINNHRPIITRKMFLLDHLFGAVIALYLLLATFIPKFPYIFETSINYEIFTTRYIFIFALAPIIAELVFAFKINYCPECRYIGNKDCELVYEEVVSITPFKASIVIGEKKVGEIVTTTTYYVDGVYDHEDVETEDKKEPIYGSTTEYCIDYRRVYECRYCGRKLEDEGHKYVDHPYEKVGDYWCAYSDPSEYRK